MSVFARNYREHYAEQSMKGCKVCGNEFVSTEQSKDVIEVLGRNDINSKQKKGTISLKCAFVEENTGLPNFLGSLIHE